MGAEVLIDFTNTLFEDLSSDRVGIASQLVVQLRARLREFERVQGDPFLVGVVPVEEIQSMLQDFRCQMLGDRSIYTTLFQGCNQRWRGGSVNHVWGLPRKYSRMNMLDGLGRIFAAKAMCKF